MINHTMKTITCLLTVSASLLFAAGCSPEQKKGKGHDDHGHPHPHPHPHEHEKKTPGPNGGRILTSVTPHLEFLVREDRKVQIAALQDAKAIPVTTQSLTLTGGDRTSPSTLNFIKEGNVLVSDKALPAGENFPVILQIKTNYETAAVTDRFQLNLADCSECAYKEYACICPH